MGIISLRNVSLAYGLAPLLDGVDLHVEKGERVGLCGRNGAGKSTMLRLLAGQIAPDGGLVDREPHLRVGFLAQEVPPGAEGTVQQVVAGGVPSAEREEAEGRRRIEAVMSRLGLDAAAPFAPLSAGNKRRVMLARALAAEPALLLLDEPTNHLDIASIEWLEGMLARFAGTVVFVTHDRAFLQAVATRIVELEVGQLYDFRCDYPTFLRLRDAAIADEERRQQEEDKKLAKEEAWLRQGVKARRTRNEGRKRALLSLREERKARRQRPGMARIALQEAARSGNLVSEAEGLTLGYGERRVVEGFSTVILRGDRVGIVGPNGCGKTTLLRALLGKLEPLAGSVRLGAKVEIAYFDQLREQLDESRTVRDNLAHGGDTVLLDGKPRHVMSYLADWLFPSERANSPLAALSGGERNRLLLARLFLQPSNLLVLDEPTNDLDVETLELLEERLIGYRGTVIVVSHDRAFLDNVVTSTIAYEGAGKFVEYAGGYSDWQLQRRGAPEQPADAPAEQARARKPKSAAPPKLTFKEQRELEALPAKIESLEAELAAVQARLADPAEYQRGGEAIAEAKGRLAALEREIEQSYARWQQLEA